MALEKITGEINCLDWEVSAGSVGFKWQFAVETVVTKIKKREVIKNGEEAFWERTRETVMRKVETSETREIQNRGGEIA